MSKPDLAAVLDHYGIRYVHKHGWGRAMCPFHDDSTPSMSINIDEGGWSCHGCGAKGGDAFAFVMLREGVPFPEAKRIVAEITGQDVDDVPAKRPGHKPGRRGGFRPRFGRKPGEAS